MEMNYIQMIGASHCNGPHRPTHDGSVEPQGPANIGLLPASHRRTGILEAANSFA